MYQKHHSLLTTKRSSLKNLITFLALAFIIINLNACAKGYGCYTSEETNLEDSSETIADTGQDLYAPETDCK